MLTLLLSRDWIAGRDLVLNMIGQDVAQRKAGAILLVPELISHDMERRLCAVAGDTSSRYAEVLSFTGLARRVSQEVSDNCPEFMDKGGRLVTMAAAALQLHSKLKAYASVETKPEFLTALVDAIDEFKCCCINAEQLAEAASKAEGSLAQKLEELSLLLNAYDALCTQGKRDPRDQMAWLLEELEASEFAKEHRFYIDGFPDFTKQHLEIIEYLISVDAHVVISMNCDEAGSKNPAFEKAGKTASEFLKIAAKHGIPVETRIVSTLSGPLQGLGEFLFQGKLPEKEYAGYLHTYRTDTMYDECCIAADKIMELVKNGARYRDISVVCTDIEGYKSTLSMVFNRCGIPSYLSGTEDILDKSVLNTVLTALEAVLDGFGQKEMIRYMKSLLSPVDPQICDQLENYAILWNISAARWSKEWTNHPEELNGKWTPYAHDQLAALNTARVKLMTPLLAFKKAMSDAVTLKEQVLALYRFLEDIEFPQRLAKLAQKLDQQGDNRNAQILNQLWEILLDAMEQLHDTLGDTVWDAQTFYRLFKLLLSQYDVGTIPTVLDSVTIGPVTAMRCQEAKHLFVLGALDGMLPGCSTTKGVLSDQERTILIDLDIHVNGGTADNLQVDFAEIYGVFNGACESVTVMCPSGEASYVYRRLLQLSEGEIIKPKYLGPALISSLESAAYLARWNQAAAAAELGLDRDYAEIISRRGHAMGIISKQGISDIYTDQLYLSASQIDRQAECRMSYFLKYGLRLKERKMATIDSAQFGTYVHAVMEDTVKAVMEAGGFRKLTMQQVLDMATGYSDKYAAEFFSQLESERIGYLFRRNTYELMLIVQELWKEMQECDFLPIGFEVGFGENEDLPAVDVSGTTMQAILNGYVDRVDLWEDKGRRYFRVVDYKTGKKNFDYCDVANGIGLQMLLYLFALEAHGQTLLGNDAFSAGVQYFPARIPLVKADGALTPEDADQKRTSELRRKGLILNDKDVLYAMENSYTPKRMSYTIKKDGTYTGDLADREQFNKLKKYVFKFLGKLVDDIASGNVEANPYVRGTTYSACTYCPYGNICHYEKENMRNYCAIKANQFWEQIERGV